MEIGGLVVVYGGVYLIISLTWLHIYKLWKMM